jgi:hypothetical protein
MCNKVIPLVEKHNKMRNNKWNYRRNLKKLTGSKNSTFAKTVAIQKQFYNEFKDELVTVTNYFSQKLLEGKRSI